MQTIDLTARLTPLTNQEYAAVNAAKRRTNPAICPCCTLGTTQGDLDDVGCCYACSILPAPAPQPDAVPAKEYAPGFGAGSFWAELFGGLR